MKFVVIIPLVLTLTSARFLLENDNQGSGVYQDSGLYGSTPSREAARKIIDYIQSLMGSGNPTAFASIFDDEFVFKSCNGKRYNKQQAVEILLKFPANVASFELETAVFAEGALIYTVNISGMKGGLKALFIARQSWKNPTGFLISSGFKRGC